MDNLKRSIAENALKFQITFRAKQTNDIRRDETKTIDSWRENECEFEHNTISLTRGPFQTNINLKYPHTMNLSASSQDYKNEGLKQTPKHLPASMIFALPPLTQSATLAIHSLVIHLSFLRFLKIAASLTWRCDDGFSS